MSAATKVFSTKGFNKTTMEEIATEAEYSPGTLYLYFKNKDELYASLTISILQYLNAKLSEVTEKSHTCNDPELILDYLLNALSDVYDFDPMILINVFHLQSSETLKKLSDEILDEIKHLSKNAIGEMANVFEQGINQGIFVDKKPIILADIAWAIYSGVVLWEDSKKILDNKKNFLKSTLKSAFEIFGHGIIAK